MNRFRFLTTFALSMALPLALSLPISSQAQTGGISKVRISTSAGDIEAELYADKAPKTVANFLQYVNDKHYDGTLFHRVIAGFMVQGGGYDAQYKEKKTRAPVPHEGRQSLAAGLKNTTGTLAMARTNDPHSATAQFFINTVDNDFLDYKSPSGQGWGYCVFGEVVEGLDVVDKIRAVKTGNKGFHQDVPVEDVIIEKAEIV